MRPLTLAEVLGQPHLLLPGKPLHNALANGHLHSMVFWGPPGTGKTTIARLLAETGSAEFIALSAVLSGVKDIRASVDAAKIALQTRGIKTLLFVDEVHRFNKAQQDAFLPHIEDGTILFVGATTQNPSFELNNALLSRLRVYVLRALDTPDIESLIHRALEDQQRGLGAIEFEVHEGVISRLAQAADGDARRALTLLEIAADLARNRVINTEVLQEAVAGGVLRRFDNGGDEFYEQISALHKSVRGSDADAALYWFCRMVDGGCDLSYIARRVLRMASEDIGNADPRALSICLDAWQVWERLGTPEGELAIAQAIVYLAVAAKSNAVYRAYGEAMQDARTSGSQPVPIHLRNAPTRLMRNLGYGKNYRYAHDEPNAIAAGEKYFPDAMDAKIYYQPVDRGLEIKIAEKLAAIRNQTR